MTFQQFNVFSGAKSKTKTANRVRLQLSRRLRVNAFVVERLHLYIASRQKKCFFRNFFLLYLTIVKEGELRKEVYPISSPPQSCFVWSKASFALPFS